MPGNSNSGRRPKPTVLKILEGTGGHRALNDKEPIPMSGAPDAPTWLHAFARELWEWVVPQLEEMGVIGRCDLIDLTALCQSWARWRQAEAEIDQFGITYETVVTFDASGSVVEPDDPKARKAKSVLKENPATKVADRERRACMAAATHLGLTPTMRSKIVAYKKQDEAPSLLSRPEALRGSS